MGVGVGLNMYDVVVKMSRSLSDLLMSFLSAMVFASMSQRTGTFLFPKKHWLTDFFFNLRLYTYYVATTNSG